MVEMLAALSGGAFSRDAAAFHAGSEPPALGLFVIAIDPTAFDPDYSARAESHLTALTADYGIDFGRRKAERTAIDVPGHVFAALTQPHSTHGAAPRSRDGGSGRLR